MKLTGMEHEDLLLTKLALTLIVHNHEGIVLRNERSVGRFSLVTFMPSPNPFIVFPRYPIISI